MLTKKLIKISMFLFIVSLLIGGCKNNNDEKDGPSGIAHYYIQNFSDYPLVVSFTKSIQLGGGVVENQTIQPNNHDEFYEDNILGQNPKPTDSFKKLELKTMIDNTLTVVYTQEPIDDDLWFIFDQNLGEDMIGNTKYQLVISNEDLTL